MIFLALTLITLPVLLICEGIPEGTKVKVLDIHIGDSYYGSKTRFIGKSGVVTEPLSESAEGIGWYSGPIKMDGEVRSNYFYAVSLEIVEMTDKSPTPTKGETTSTIIDRGTKVMILDISPEDAYYSDRKEIIGQICVVVDILEVSNEGDGWYAGEVQLEGQDKTYYFYAVSIKIVSE